jgi:hypothetical protein
LNRSPIRNVTEPEETLRCALCDLFVPRVQTKQLSPTVAICVDKYGCDYRRAVEFQHWVNAWPNPS